MEVDSGLLGVEESLAALARFAEQEEKALQSALEYILHQMCVYVKRNGPWTDRTGFLRNSISVNMDTMRLWTKEDALNNLEALVSENETPVIKIEGEDYVGCLSAQIEYAIWVELKDGYWVLTGAIDRFEPLLEKYFADKMAVDKLDLEETATITYLKHQTRQQFG